MWTSGDGEEIFVALSLEEDETPLESAGEFAATDRGPWNVPSLCPLHQCPLPPDHMQLRAGGSGLLELSPGVFAQIKFWPLSGAAFYLKRHPAKLGVFLTQQAEITASPRFPPRPRVKWCEAWLARPRLLLRVLRWQRL